MNDRERLDLCGIGLLTQFLGVVSIVEQRRLSASLNSSLFRNPNLQ